MAVRRGVQRWCVVCVMSVLASLPSARSSPFPLPGRAGVVATPSEFRLPSSPGGIYRPRQHVPMQRVSPRPGNHSIKAQAPGIDLYGSSATSIHTYKIAVRPDIQRPGEPARPFSVQRNTTGRQRIRIQNHPAMNLDVISPRMMNRRSGVTSLSHRLVPDMSKFFFKPKAHAARIVNKGSHATKISAWPNDGRVRQEMPSGDGHVLDRIPQQSSINDELESQELDDMEKSLEEQRDAPTHSGEGYNHVTYVSVTVPPTSLYNVTPEGTSEHPSFTRGPPAPPSSDAPVYIIPEHGSAASATVTERVPPLTASPPFIPLVLNPDIIRTTTLGAQDPRVPSSTTPEAGLTSEHEHAPSNPSPDIGPNGERPPGQDLPQVPVTYLVAPPLPGSDRRPFEQTQLGTTEHSVSGDVGPPDKNYTWQPEEEDQSEENNSIEYEPHQGMEHPLNINEHLQPYPGVVHPVPAHQADSKSHVFVLPHPEEPSSATRYQPVSFDGQHHVEPPHTSYGVPDWPPVREHHHTGHVSTSVKTEPAAPAEGGQSILSATPGPADLPLHSWERLTWADRPQLSTRQASALLEEELMLREAGGPTDRRHDESHQPPTEPTPASVEATSQTISKKKVRVKKVRKAKNYTPDASTVSAAASSREVLSVDDSFVLQPHMLDGLEDKARVRRQHLDDDVPRDLREEESRVKRGGHHMGVTGPVHTFVKTDKHGHYKWGVRHHVGHNYA